MPDGRKVKFTVYLDSVSIPPDTKDLPRSSSESKTAESSKSFNTIPVSDEEILRAQRSVETLTGAKTGGKDADYSLKNGVYLGAYQIDPRVWQREIKSKLGWDVNDWFNANPTNEDGSDIYKQRQDTIAKEVLLPESKRQIKSKGLYENTLLGRYLPKGALEIASQLGVSNLERFLNTGKDPTKIRDQVVKYLIRGMKSVNREIPQAFFDKLEELDPGVNQRLRSGANLASR